MTTRTRFGGRTLSFDITDKLFIFFGLNKLTSLTFMPSSLAVVAEESVASRAFDFGDRRVPHDGLGAGLVDAPAHRIIALELIEHQKLQILLIGLLGHQGFDLIGRRKDLAGGVGALEVFIADFALVDEGAQVAVEAFAAVAVAAAAIGSRVALLPVVEADGAGQRPRFQHHRRRFWLFWQPW